MAKRLRAVCALPKANRSSGVNKQDIWPKLLVPGTFS